MPWIILLLINEEPIRTVNKPFSLCTIAFFEQKQVEGRSGHARLTGVLVACRRNLILPDLPPLSVYIRF